MSKNEFKSLKCDDKQYPSIQNTGIYWNVNSSDIIARPIGTMSRGELDAYKMSGFGCYSLYKKSSGLKLQKMLMRDILSLIIRDNVCQKAVHNVFLGIREYRECLSYDQPNYDGYKYNDE